MTDSPRLEVNPILELLKAGRIVGLDPREMLADVVAELTEQRATDSPRLEEVLAAVLAEHVYSFQRLSCSCNDYKGRPEGHDAHVAERLAARFEQVGEADAKDKLVSLYDPWDAIPNRVPLVHPLFRLVGGDQ